jgi:hypothetical protein
MPAKSSPAMNARNSKQMKPTSWTHIQVRLEDYNPDFKIEDPNRAEYDLYVDDEFYYQPALNLTINTTPNCTELHNRSRVKVNASMLKGDNAMDRAWEAGEWHGKKVGKTFNTNGTDTPAKMHAGMAVINAPTDDPGLMKQVTAKLAEFVKKQEENPNPTTLFSKRGTDGKLMFFYDFIKSDVMEKGSNGKWHHKVYADAKSAKQPKAYVDIRWKSSICDNIARLPPIVAKFVVSYLKGLAALFECSHADILTGSMMLLDYSEDGGFSSHIDGYKDFNSQAGFVVLLSMSDIEDELKSFDLTPIWDQSTDKPIRITTTGNQAILLTGLARVDEPHSIPFFMNRKGGRTFAFKFPFLNSKSPFVRLVRSELSGAEAQMFDADMAIKAEKDSAGAEELCMAQGLSSLSVSAEDFNPLNAEAREFTPSFLSEEQLSLLRTV